MTSDDVIGLVELFKACFGIDVSGDYFEWKYRANPTGEAIAFVADAGDRLGAFYGVIPEPWSVGGREATVHQSMDTMTHPDFQRRGLFVKLAERTYDEVRRRRVRCDLVGIPGPAPLPGFISKLGWTKIHEFQLLTAPTFVVRNWPRRGGKSITVESVERPDDRIHAVLDRSPDPAGEAWPRLRGAFFDWRVFGRSPKQLRVALASRDGQPIALCVYGRTSPRTTLVSYVAGLPDYGPGDWFPPLLRFVAKHGTILYTWRPQSPRLNDLYRSMAFRVNPVAPASLKQPSPLIVRSDDDMVNGLVWADPEAFDLQPLMQD
jgi:GNAT superfamily N-acetyltransferase